MPHNLKVAIPLKTNSERIANKNLRAFSGTDSLFDVKARQLLSVFDPNDVYVSSENPEVECVVKQYGFNFHLRDLALTKSTAKENQIVKAVTDAIPGKPDIMWVQVTQPLFNEFQKIIDIWRELDSVYDSLAVVKRMRHHVLDERGNPVNFNFGYWHKISQDLPHFYEVTWAAFVMRREMLEEAYYQIGRHPYLYQTDAPLVDINDPVEFEMASILYDHYVAQERMGVSPPV
jgi:N-acylneuraminate cytidylyltransferase